MEILGKKNRNIHRMSNHVWHVSGGEGAVVRFSANSQYRNYNAGIQSSILLKSGDSAGIMSWGGTNDLPVKRVQLVAENNIVPQIMRTQRNLLIGAGLIYFRERFEGKNRIIEELPKPNAAKDFLEQCDIEDTFLPQLAQDLIFNATMLPEFVRTKGGKIFSVEAKECSHARSGLMNRRGKVDSWYWNGGWASRERNVQLFDTLPLPIYDRNQRQNRFIFVLGDRLLHDDHYNIPVWEGSRDWIELANLIPQWHISNINNGLTPRWHIEIPSNYFYDAARYGGLNIDDLDEEQYAAMLVETDNLRKAFLQKVNNVLGGVEGAGNTLWTEYDWSEALGKEYSGIRITALKAELNHEAYTSLFDATNVANVSAHGLPPVLASIQTAGRMSAGAEIRNSLYLHVIINTPHYRQKLAKILNFIHRTNEWDMENLDGQWGFRDVEITKLDDNKAGHSGGTTG
jgi:hypothetical protein